jgi:bifunctional DNase/RNase
VAVDHVYGMRTRHIVERSNYCAEHVQHFAASYYAASRVGTGPSRESDDGVIFDIEMLLYDDRTDKPCYLSLREAGGSRRLDCAIGFFEAAALWWQLEPFQHPRPLTHGAMGSIIDALGGSLEFVIIDKYFPSQAISFEAKLYIRQMNVMRIVDVRLSDAVVLAVVCKVPIFVAHAVLGLL